MCSRPKPPAPAIRASQPALAEGKKRTMNKARKPVEEKLSEAFAAFKAAFRDGKEHNDYSLPVAAYIVSYAARLNDVERKELRDALRYVLMALDVIGNCGD